MIKYVRTKSNHADFRYLIDLLDKDLLDRNGEVQTQYDPYNKIDYIDTVIIAYLNTTAIGCGCFKKNNEYTAEIKRMFVIPDQRGKGVAKGILNELELWAKELSYTTIVLETGKKQIEAIHVYKKSGYSVTANYEPYIGMPDSICMKKNLV